LARESSFLVLSGVGAAYRRIDILRDIDLTLARGASLAILGANGAGKTTMLRAISGIMVRRSGSIMFENTELTALAPHEIVGRGISHVPEGKHLFLPLTVAENIEIGALPLHQTGKSAEASEAKQLVYDLFPILRERASQVAGTLSGGEQQMLAIARALMSRPKLLLLDEPSVGLAPRVNEALFAALARLKQLGVAIIVAEQVVQLACELADRAVVLHLGKLAMAGSAREVRQDPELKRLYLGA
jgi:branched-chain amino acid transport system ATP-binding protein